MKSFNIGDLKIPVPIIQGGMGIGISLSGLASAVANRGGVGVIATVGIGLVNGYSNQGYRIANIEALRKEIQKARKLTSGILGVNIMSVLTNFSDMVKTSIEEGIDIIFSGAGLPLDLPKYLSKGVKTKLVPIVSSSRAASIISQKWKQNFNYLPDAFVVEGPKAGGHLGFKPAEIDQEEKKLENLVLEVKQVADEIQENYQKEVPVIAAGGIFTGEDIHKVMKLGASAVQLGTRFVATTECDASETFKNTIIEAGDEKVQIIKSPVGMPGRAIYNNFLEEAVAGKRKPEKCSFNCIKSCNPKTTLYCICEALLAAYHGNMADGFAFTGANASRVTKMSTVNEVFDELEAEYSECEKKDIAKTDIG
ncbi:MAG: nitronate monooxygenase [Bacteroidales bacterium]|nr:nitronate monooxygenase [Bacteroidales bacterium]MBN2818693.1 nitronate monooxygenase [Bacteroidales bacterium]